MPRGIRNPVTTPALGTLAYYAVSLRVPPARAQAYDAAAQSLGYPTRSEFFRAILEAVIDHPAETRRLLRADEMAAHRATLEEVRASDLAAVWALVEGRLDGGERDVTLPDRLDPEEARQIFEGVQAWKALNAGDDAPAH